MPPSIDQIRASLTVLLAKAIQDIFPKIELIRGRVTDHGFVYDLIAGSQEIDTHALQRLEERMLELIREEVSIKNIQMLRDNAVDYFIHQRQPIKAALAARAKTELLDLIQVDSLFDWVEGTGAVTPSQLKFFKLIHSKLVTKSYPSAGTLEVHQIVGSAFPTKDALKHYLKRLDSTQFLDHQQFGDQMALFYCDQTPGEEGVYWLQRGLIVKKSLEILAEEAYHQAGFECVHVPAMVAEKVDFVAKLYARFRKKKRRFAQLSWDVREDLDFDSLGLWRSACYFADQAWVFAEESELDQALISSLQLIHKIVNMFASGYRWVLCRSEGGAGKKLFGDDKAVRALTRALEECGVEYTFEERLEDYRGPRAYLCLPDMYGKYWKGPFVGMPLRSKEVKKSGVWLVESSLFGSFDRLIAYLLEQRQGRLPLSLAPEQVRVVSQRYTSHDYARQVSARVHAYGIRVGIDVSEEKLGAKIHRAEEELIPYIVVVGDEEMRAQTVALRAQNADGNMLKMTIDVFLENLCEKLKETTCSP